MATAPRVPLVISNNYSKVRQCHKCSWVALPERSSLSSHYSNSFSASSFCVEKRVRKGFSRGAVITAMADSDTSTVLVTGAGGRTGTLFLSVSLGFVEFLKIESF